MYRKIKAGTTSLIITDFVIDLTKTATNDPGLAIAYNTASLIGKYKRKGDSSWTSITLVTATAGTFTSGGVAVATGGQTGDTEFHIPNAAIAAGADMVWIEFYGAANMRPVKITIELDLFDYQVATQPVNLTQIDGQATNANNATLNLKQLNIVNNAGIALVAQSTGSNGHGIAASGHGTGSGLSAAGGATSGCGVLTVGGGTGDGIQANSGGGATGNGIKATALSTSASGISAFGSGASHGANFTGGLTGAGMRLVGGGTSGPGLSVVTTAGNAIALAPTGGTGINIVTAGAQNGVFINPGTTGVGIIVQGGSTSGDAVQLNTTSGHGITGTIAGAGKYLINGTIALVGDITGTVTGIGVAVWNALLATHTTAATFGKLLQDMLNAAVGSRAVPGDAMTLTVGERTAVGSAVRTELAVELARVDVAISTRMATFVYTAPPSAAAIATQVRTELGVELGRIDVAISSRMATFVYTTPPTVAAIATQVRVELGVELGRIDVAVSTRMATFVYTTPPTAVDVANQVTTDHGAGSYVRNTEPVVPDNASVAAIKVVTDKLATMLQVSGLVYQYTVDALELAPSGGGGGSGPVGPGADLCTMTITVLGTAVADADVWITTDEAGLLTVAGTLQTDSMGQIAFMLDEGNTYYLWAQKNGINSIMGQEFVAVAD